MNNDKSIFSRGPGPDMAASVRGVPGPSNSRVIEHGVLAGHFAATAACIAASECPILILQDTAELICAARSRGNVGSPRASTPDAARPGSLTCCRVLMHSSLTVTLTSYTRSDVGEF
ncbi:MULTISPECIES: hypothetical protein [unclassified Mesorhizobium]|uniref:hypothetical protein n=1 Tax=unclassified Mesorhizobium TaxID=325217 RepID=UPI001FDFA569|nr:MULTISPECIES: hypothetical protein [unclassified Mesorhizobium]